MQRKIKVAILISDLYLNTLHPLYRALFADDRFEITVWASRRVGYDFAPGVSSLEISQMLTANGIPHGMDPTRESLSHFGPDFVFTSNPYDMYMDPELESGWISTVSRLAHISYGAALVEWTNEYEFLAKNPYMERAYRVYTESPLLHRSRSNFKPVGYVKLADYASGARKPLKFSLPSIAWKPRWTKHDDEHLLKIIEQMGDLSENRLINLVIHPMLLSNNNGRAGQALQQLASRPNVNSVTGPYFLDEVLGSDIYVGDVSSTLAEFLWTSRPIIYTGSIEGLNELGGCIIDSCYRAQVDDIESVILEIEKGNDGLAKRRDGLFDVLFPANETSPIGSIKRDLLEIGPCPISRYDGM